MNDSTTEETEIRIAQDALAKAKQRLADATEAKLSSARRAIADAEAEAIRKRDQELKEYEAKVAIHVQREKERKDARLADQRAKENEARLMQEELAKLELQRQEQRKHEELLQRMADDEARISREAAQAEADALRMSAPPTAEPEITLMSSAHPLSFIFNPSAAVQAEPEKPKIVYQDPVQAPELRKENPEERGLLMSAFTNKGLCVNPLTIVNMSLRFEPAPIMRALEIVMSDARLQNTYAVQAIESILWKPETDPEEIISSVIVTREADKTRREAEKVRCEEESRRG